MGKGMVDAAITIFRQEGFVGLYKGVVPTSMRAAVVAASEIASYDEIKCALLRRQWLPDGVALHLLVGVMSGFFASFVSSPFDVIKSRLMSQPFDVSGVGQWYSGTVDCFYKSF